MLTFGMSITGLTDKELAQAAEAVKPNLAGEMVVVMAKGRSMLVTQAQGIFIAHGRRGRPRTVTSLIRAKAASKVFPWGVVGTLSHRAFLLNIFEGGAHPKAFTLTPKPGKAIRFYKGGRAMFMRGPKEIPARTIKARPLVRPIMNQLLPYARARVEQVVVETINHAAG